MADPPDRGATESKARGGGPGRRRWLRPALIGIAVVAVAVVAAGANIALLGAVGEDRIGLLRPVDPTLANTRGITATAPDLTGLAPPADDDDGSSGRGRGRGRSGESDDD